MYSRNRSTALANRPTGSLFTNRKLGCWLGDICGSTWCSRSGGCWTLLLARRSNRHLCWRELHRSLGEIVLGRKPSWRRTVRRKSWSRWIAWRPKTLTIGWIKPWELGLLWIARRSWTRDLRLLGWLRRRVTLWRTWPGQALFDSS